MRWVEKGYELWLSCGYFSSDGISLAEHQICFAVQLSACSKLAHPWVWCPKMRVSFSMRRFAFCSFYFLMWDAWKRPLLYWFATHQRQVRKFFSSKIRLWSYPPRLIQSHSTNITRERIDHAFNMSMPKYWFILSPHKQESCQPVNSFLLAHIMPSKKHNKRLNIFTYSNK